MAEKLYRIGIVGASSLTGRELADVLSESALGASTVVLLDDEELTGTMTAAGDEVTFIQKLDESSFAGMDLVFFTGSPKVAAAHWQNAQAAGATILDLTHALTSLQDVVVRSPWISSEPSNVSGSAPGRAGNSPNLQAIVEVAHPAAVMLALVASRLASVGIRSMAATVMEPASQAGTAGIDELQQQTVKLLSFQEMPKEQYDAQVAFNLLQTLGDRAGAPIAANESRIRKHYDLLGAGRLTELALQLIQAPVFHSYAASVHVELSESASVSQVEAALSGVHVEVVRDDTDAPDNVRVAGEDKVHLRVRTANRSGTGFWIWMVADNIKLHALSAVGCATELRSLRPAGTIQ